ncbi:hypothetical protein B0H34DRAFT_372245 [Crassisporium funariophilum]|nr:hypothetical protein B0H34DRAFT_372245 [Crassisporium funariophilum]
MAQNRNQLQHYDLFVKNASTYPPQLAMIGTANILVFQFGDRWVAVKPVANFEEAIDIARKEFRELANVARDRLEFNVEAASYDPASQRLVRISEGAWAEFTRHLPRYSIIRISVHQDEDTILAPPKYHEVPASSSSNGKSGSSKVQGPIRPPRPKASSSAARSTSEYSNCSDKSQSSIFSIFRSGNK